MKKRVALLSAALWWGSLGALGAVVVPLLFAHLPTPAMAGAMAARLFSAQSWISIGCAMLLLMTTLKRESDSDDHEDRSPGLSQPSSMLAVMPIILGLLLALLIEYAVAPRIVARENLRLWHSLGTLMFVLQWLCAGVALWRLGRRTPE